MAVSTDTDTSSETSASAATVEGVTVEKVTPNAAFFEDKLKAPDKALLKKIIDTRIPYVKHVESRDWVRRKTSRPEPGLQTIKEFLGIDATTGIESIDPADLQDDKIKSLAELLKKVHEDKDKAHHQKRGLYFHGPVHDKKLELLNEAELTGPKEGGEQLTLTSFLPSYQNTYSNFTNHSLPALEDATCNCVLTEDILRERNAKQEQQRKEEAARKEAWKQEYEGDLSADLLKAVQQARLKTRALKAFAKAGAAHRERKTGERPATEEASIFISSRADESPGPSHETRNIPEDSPTVPAAAAPPGESASGSGPAPEVTIGGDTPIVPTPPLNPFAYALPVGDNPFVQTPTAAPNPTPLEYTLRGEGTRLFNDQKQYEPAGIELFPLAEKGIDVVPLITTQDKTRLHTALMVQPNTSGQLEFLEITSPDNGWDHQQDFENAIDAALLDPQTKWLSQENYFKFFKDCDEREKNYPNPALRQGFFNHAIEEQQGLARQPVENPSVPTPTGGSVTFSPPPAGSSATARNLTGESTPSSENRDTEEQRPQTPQRETYRFAHEGEGGHEQLTTSQNNYQASLRPFILYQGDPAHNPMPENIWDTYRASYKDNEDNRYFTEIRNKYWPATTNDEKKHRLDEAAKEDNYLPLQEYLAFTQECSRGKLDAETRQSTFKKHLEEYRKSKLEASRDRALRRQNDAESIADAQAEQPQGRTPLSAPPPLLEESGQQGRRIPREGGGPQGGAGGPQGQPQPPETVDTQKVFADEAQQTLGNYRLNTGNGTVPLNQITKEAATGALCTQLAFALKRAPTVEEIENLTAGKSATETFLAAAAIYEDSWRNIIPEEQDRVNSTIQAPRPSTDAFSKASEAMNYYAGVIGTNNSFPKLDPERIVTSHANRVAIQQAPAQPSIPPQAQAQPGSPPPRPVTPQPTGAPPGTSAPVPEQQPQVPGAVPGYYPAMQPQPSSQPPPETPQPAGAPPGTTAPGQPPAATVHMPQAQPAAGPPPGYPDLQAQAQQAAAGASGHMRPSATGNDLLSGAVSGSNPGGNRRSFTDNVRSGSSATHHRSC